MKARRIQPHSARAYRGALKVGDMIREGASIDDVEVHSDMKRVPFWYVRRDQESIRSLSWERWIMISSSSKFR